MGNGKVSQNPKCETGEVQTLCDWYQTQKSLVNLKLVVFFHHMVSLNWRACRGSHQGSLVFFLDNLPCLSRCERPFRLWRGSKQIWLLICLQVCITTMWMNVSPNQTGNTEKKWQTFGGRKKIPQSPQHKNKEVKIKKWWKKSQGCLDIHGQWIIDFCGLWMSVLTNQQDVFCSCLCFFLTVECFFKRHHS